MTMVSRKKSFSNSTNISTLIVYNEANFVFFCCLRQGRAVHIAFSVQDWEKYCLFCSKRTVKSFSCASHIYHCDSLAIPSCCFKCHFTLFRGTHLLFSRPLLICLQLHQEHSSLFVVYNASLTLALSCNCHIAFLSFRFWWSSFLTHAASDFAPLIFYCFCLALLCL